MISPNATPTRQGACMTKEKKIALAIMLIMVILAFISYPIFLMVLRLVALGAVLFFVMRGIKKHS